MSKYIRRVSALIIVISLLFTMVSCSSKKGDNDEQISETVKSSIFESRYLFVSNKTNEKIKEVRVEIGQAQEIYKDDDCKLEKDGSVKIKISRKYKNNDSFRVILVDVFGLDYVKGVTQVNKHGITEVIITKDDYEKKHGDLGGQINKLFN